MKPILTARKYLAALALAILAAGCATSELLDLENVALAADFKVITPTKPDQLTILRKLPPGKVTLINYGGKPYYILPDLKNNQAYIGGPKQYQVYQQDRRIQVNNSKNRLTAPETAQTLQATETNWGEWGGWAGMAGMGALGWY